MRRGSMIMLMAATLLGGCYSFSGPAPVIDSHGVAPRDAERRRSGEYYQRFREAAIRASGCLPADPATIPAADFRCPSVPGPESDALLRNYMRAGFLLIVAECDDYFAHMSRNQGRSRLVRDSIGPIANLITGLVALRGSSAGGIPALALGTGAATSTLDIFDQRFLFGADNIDAVSELVLLSLGAQAEEALALTELNFERASAQIIRNQRICTPSRILTLTRQSIQSAVPRASTPRAAPPSPAPAASPPPPPPQAPPAGQGMSSTSVSVPPR